MKELEIRTEGFVRKSDEFGLLPCDPYTLAFVYHPDGKILIKGYLTEVRNHIKEKYPKSVVNYSFYRKNTNIRGYWKVTNTKIYVTKGKSTPTYHNDKVKWIFWQNNKAIASFRRIPMKWIPLFEKFYTI